MSLHIQLEPLYILTVLFIGFLWQVYKLSQPIWRLPFLRSIEVYNWKDKYVMVILAALVALVHGWIASFLSERYAGLYMIPEYSILDYSLMYVITTSLYELGFKFLKDVLVQVKRKWFAFVIVGLVFFGVWWILKAFDLIAF